MQWDRLYPRLFIPLLVLAVCVILLGVFMPDIREHFVYQPRAAKIERAMEELAERQRTALKTRGGFQTFGTQESPIRLKALGIDISTWPSEDYLFEASVQPNRHLRLRALPRPEAVRELKVRPRLYVADLNPAGGVTSKGWFP